MSLIRETETPIRLAKCSLLAKQGECSLTNESTSATNAFSAQDQSGSVQTAAQIHTPLKALLFPSIDLIKLSESSSQGTRGPGPAQSVSAVFPSCYSGCRLELEHLSHSPAVVLAKINAMPPFEPHSAPSDCLQNCSIRARLRPHPLT
jgi:hypothetical protein